MGTASVSPTPIEPTCGPSPIVTAVPQGQTAQFHAVGVFSDNSHQDITNDASTVWTTGNASVVTPQGGTPGSYFAAGSGCAMINANAAGLSGSPEVVIDVPPIPAACPTPGPPVPADPFGP